MRFTLIEKIAARYADGRRGNRHARGQEVILDQLMVGSPSLKLLPAG